MGVWKRKRKDGTESENWYVDYRDPTGKKVVKAIGPKKDAEAYLGKIKGAIREKRYFDIKKEAQVKFEELVKQYEDKIQDQEFYKSSVRYFLPAIKEYFKGKMLSEIDYKSLEDFRDRRKKTPTQHGTTRSERTVDIEMALLNRIFRKGVRWGMLERNPFERGEDLFFRNTVRRERALTEDEVKHLIDACPPYLKSIVITAVYTGLRKGDILNLKWKDIDLDRGIIRLVEDKTRKIRNIVLNNDMMTLFHSLPVEGEYVFPGKNGKPLRDIKRSFQTALDEAGIKQSEDPRLKVVFHTLRHTCVSLLTERGADTTAVKNYVAHASEEMTEHYTHLTAEYSRKTGEKLDGLYPVSQVYGNKMETISKNQGVNS